ncbi:hypothetical protein ACW14X_09175 [Nocardioides sp. YJ-D4]
MIIVDRLMKGGAGRSEEEDSRDLAALRANVPYPGVSDLIFYWDGAVDHEPTAEEVVDAALAY